MNIIFSYEHLYPPYDEGVKNLAYMIYETLDSEHTVKVVKNISRLPNFINSILIIPRIIIRSIINRAEKVIYIPKGAFTFSAIIKIWLASLILGNKLVSVSVQRKTLSPLQKSIVSKIHLKNVFTLSNAMAKELTDVDISASVLPTGIDQVKFSPLIEDIQILRTRYSLPVDKKILLHVGHIKESRNILWLLDIQQSVPDFQVVIIGSTATEQDDQVRLKLEKNGIIVLREALNNIQELYQAADIYCFPVTEMQGAMEIPLSVLEAMAVNLPVISTRFGRLPELFNEDDCYKFVDLPSEIISILESGFGTNCSNRDKVSDFTWMKTASKLISS